ncbi:MAG: hypothetical protein QNJ98_17980 [Planctomycetota bacterium]|nr:hypothetical protein [Planctomycetota bacterium]
MTRSVRLSIFVLILVACAGCCRRACGPTPSAVEPPAWSGTTAGFGWVILPEETGIDWFMGGGPEAWRPDARTVRTALGAVRGHLEAQLERTWPAEELDTEAWHEILRGVLAQLGDYRCQAIGYIDGDRRLVFLNFVHRVSLEPHPDDDPNEPDRWPTEPHLVDDGGDYYWQVVYDPAKRQFFHLYVNGEA